MKLKEEIVSLMKKLGSDLIGFTNTDIINENEKSGHKAEDWLPGAKSAIVFALKLLDGPLNGLPFTRSAYDWNKVYLDTQITQISMKLCRYLEDLGYLSVPITFEPQIFNPLRGDISVKHAAVAAGLGHIGLSDLLITPEYGPRVRLEMVITTAEIEPDKPLEKNPCPMDYEKCGKCIRACPSKAMYYKNGKIKRRWIRCALYMYKDLAALPTDHNGFSF